MLIRQAALIGLALLSTGCAAFEGLRHEKLYSDLEKGRDTCGLKHLKPFIGMPLDDLSIRDHLPSKYSYRIFDPRPFLAGGLDQIATTDLRPRRQNISVDAQGIITDLDCS